MNGPNADLMRIYETRDVYEQKLAGSAPLAARLLFGLLNVGNTQADAARERMLALNAQEMNGALAQARAMMMLAPEQRLQHTRVPIALLAMRGGAPMMRGDDIPLGMDDGMVRLAQAIGCELAHADLEKDAGIGDSLGMVGRALGTATKGLGQRALTQGTGAIRSAMQGVQQNAAGMVNKVNSFPGKLSQGVSNKIEQVGAKMEGKINSALGGPGGSSIKPRTPQIGGRVRTPEVPAPPGVKPTSGGQPNIQKPMEASEPNAGGFKPPMPPPQSAPAAPGAPASPPGPASAGKVGPPTGQFNPTDALSSAWKRTGLSEGAWKWKLPALALGAGAAYGAVRGAKALAGKMSEESEPYQFNRGAAQPAAGINEYGYADRSTPFTT